MSVIGTTTVNGTTNINLQYCPEFICIGDPFDNTTNLLPSAFKVSVSGTQNIDLKTTALIKAFGAVFGNLTETASGLATGAVRLGKIYRVAYGQANGKNTDISISQPAGGAAQNIYGWSTQKGAGKVITAKQMQINANTPQIFEGFDFLAIDGAIDDLEVKYRASGWSERMLTVELQALNNLRRSLDPAGTIADLTNVFPNFDRLMSMVTVYNGANARNALILGTTNV